MLPPAIAHDLQCFLRILHSRYGEDLVSVVLFGSWARGEARAESDIDLLVISKHFPGSRLDRHRDMFEAVKAVTKDFALKASILPLTPAEASTTKPFYLGMLTAHAVLYDHDEFFTIILQRLRRRLAELGSERRVDKDGCKQPLPLKWRGFATTTRMPVGQRVMRLSQGRLQAP